MGSYTHRSSNLIRMTCYVSSGILNHSICLSYSLARNNTQVKTTEHLSVDCTETYTYNSKHQTCDMCTKASSVVRWFSLYTKWCTYMSHGLDTVPSSDQWSHTAIHSEEKPHTCRLHVVMCDCAHYDIKHFCRICHVSVILMSTVSIVYCKAWFVKLC